MADVHHKHVTYQHINPTDDEIDAIKAKTRAGVIEELDRALADKKPFVFMSEYNNGIRTIEGGVTDPILLEFGLRILKNAGVDIIELSDMLGVRH